MRSAGALLNSGSMGGKPARLLNSTREGIVVVVVVGSGSLRGGGAPSFSKALRRRSLARALPRCPGRGFFAKRRVSAGLLLWLLMKPPVLDARSPTTQTRRRSMALLSL